jgi:hypothetical protein
MFDQPSRDNLKECGFYEGYVIREILEIQELAIGKVSDQHYTIRDEGPFIVSMGFTDSLGAAHTANFSKKLTPLILASAFKLLDQIWEWILFENSYRPSGAFWSFKGKFDCFSNKPITFPDFLNTEPIFQSVVKNLFTYFWPRRNAIIHSKWGTIVNKDLNFDFSYSDLTQPGKPTVNIKEIIKFNEIVCFADFSYQLFLNLIKPENQNTGSLYVLKILADKLSSFHNCTSFRVIQIHVFHVHRITSMDKISIREIRDKLEPNAFGKPYTFLLKVTDEKTNHSWDVNSENLPQAEEIKLADLEKYSTKS